MYNNLRFNAGALAPKSLNEARLNAHYAVQWLARIARGYIQSKPDDSHTCLSWIPEDNALTTKFLPNGIYFGLVIPELLLFCTTSNELIDELSLDGKTDNEVGEWVKGCIQDMGFPTEPIDIPLPYSIEHHPLKNNASYDQIDTALGLRELSFWFDDAYNTMKVINSDFSKQFSYISNINCWPHHFDMAHTLQVRSYSPETMPVISVGLSPGDEYYNEPYYYVTPWPYLKPIGLPDLPFIGHWHLRGFVGAVTLGSKIIELDNREKDVLAFLRHSIMIGQKILSS